MFGRGFIKGASIITTVGLINGAAALTEAKGPKDKHENAKKSIEVAKVEKAIKTQVKSTIERNKLMAELGGLDDNKDGTLDSTEQEDIDTRGQLDDLIADIQSNETLSESDMKLLAEYKAKLGDGPMMEELAMELVKGRKEFIESKKQGTRLNKLKDEAKKDKFANKQWERFLGQLLKGEAFRGYETLYIDAPLLAKYIAENYNSLIGKNKYIDLPLNIIGSNYNIAESKNNIAESKNNIAEGKKIIDKNNRIINNYKKILGKQ